MISGNESDQLPTDSIVIPWASVINLGEPMPSTILQLRTPIAFKYLAKVFGMLHKKDLKRLLKFPANVTPGLGAIFNYISASEINC